MRTMAMLVGTDVWMMFELHGHRAARSVHIFAKAPLHFFVPILDFL